MSTALRLLGVFSCLAIGAVSAQQQERPTFRGAVDLVTMDVTVLDGDSRPVSGLTVDDFEVKLNGKVQPVKVVSFLELGPPELATSAPAGAAPATVVPERPVFSNAAAPAPDPRLFVVLLDDLSLMATRGRPLLTAAQRFVSGLPPNDYVGFATSSGTTLVNPTRDRKAIVDTLARVSGGATDLNTIQPGDRSSDSPDSAVGVARALAIDRGDLGTLRDVIATECFGGDRQAVESQAIPALAAENECVSTVQRQARQAAELAKANMARQASAMASVVESMRSATGFKQLVVLTDGLAVDSNTGPLEELARTAARAGVRINLLVEEADFNIADEGRRDDNFRQVDTGMARRRREDATLTLDGAATAAIMAGGQLFRVIGDPDPFFDRVVRASSAVYRLGVEPLPDTVPGREFKVEVKLKARKGLSVAANRIAVVPEPVEPATAPATPAENAGDRLEAVLGSGEARFAIPIEIGTLVRRASGEPAAGASLPLEVVVDVEIPASVSGPLTTMYGLVDGAGHMTSGRRELSPPAPGQPFNVSFVLPVASGDYRLRFTAADPNGGIGTIEVPLKASLATVGPFVASDIIAAWVDSRGEAHLLVLKGLPVGTTSLRAALELYPSSASAPLPDDVLVEWTITKAGDDFAIDRREAAPQLIAGVRRAVAEFGTDGYEPGTYTIRATVRHGDDELGALTRTFQVGGSLDRPDRKGEGTWN